MGLKATYPDGKGWVEDCFSPDMIWRTFSFILGERLVRYRLKLARGLRSLHSANLLRLLMTQQGTGFLTITPEDFCNTMELPESYFNN